MFTDRPDLILPLEPGDIFKLSWDTKGPIAGPFSSPIESEHHIPKPARRFMDRVVDRLEEYLPFDFEFKKDNRKAHVRLHIADARIQVEGVELKPWERITGIVVPQGVRHTVVLADAPYWTSDSKRTAVHELGHALGLSHPGTGGADPDYNSRDTIMSYNVVDDNWWFRPADIERLQEIWTKPKVDPVTGAYVTKRKDADWAEFI